MSKIKVGRVAMVPITSIIVEDRIREEMGDLVGLESSLKESGLAQPLAVKAESDGNYRLLAGGRRYTVLLANQVPEIPVRIYDEDLTPLQSKIIEKAENFFRKDMEHWEMDKLVYEIHTLEQQEKGTAHTGQGSTGHTLKDTAEIVGKTDAYVSGAIKRHEAREAFPDLFANCRTQKDATNVMKKMDEAIIKRAIAEKLENESSSGTTLSKLSNSFIIKDCFEGIKEIPDGVIQLVEIDPPYAIDLRKKKKSDGESQYIKEDYNEIDSKDYQQFLHNLFHECYRVMADHSWLICWFAPEPWFNTVFLELDNAGFKTSRMCGIWTKPGGQSMRPDIYLANTYEMFFYAWKGRPALHKAGRTNVFDKSDFPPVPPQHKVHPTERPVSLMTELYDTFAQPGSRILIPFLGSGNGLIAAYKLGMDAVGFELSRGYKDSFLVRINNGIN